MAGKNGKGSGADQPEQLASMAMPDSTYMLSSDVATVVERVIQRFPHKFGHLANARLACLLRASKRSEDEFGVDSSGHAFIRSDLERGITATYDAGVWFRRRWWEKMAVEKREAWVFHQLSHLHARPSGGGLVMVGHDVEAFADEPVYFGAWDEQLALFEQNLDEYTPGAGLRRSATPPAAGATPPVN